MIWLTLGLGLVLLLAGAEFLVKGAVQTAAGLRVPPFVIGLTLVGFGTSTPELVASVEAALLGAPAIAFGNVIGSNIANILLILGLAALIRPIAGDHQANVRDWAFFAGSTVAVVVIVWADGMGRAIALALIATLVLYVAWSVSAGRRDGTAGETDYTATWPMWRALAVAAAGIVAVVWGADLLIEAALVIARAYGIPEATIGLTLVAVGTSLPELATSVIAALRRQGDVALANVIGSNIFNVFGILGVTALAAPVAGTGMDVVDLAVLILATLALLVLGLLVRSVRRSHGLAMVVVYTAYVGWLALRPGVTGV